MDFYILWILLLRMYRNINKLVLARGYLFLDENTFEEALIPAKHYRLDFLRFLIKREFNNYAINGFYCNIFLLINEEYPINAEQLKKIAY